MNDETSNIAGANGKSLGANGKALGSNGKVLGADSEIQGADSNKPVADSKKPNADSKKLTSTESTKLASNYLLSPIQEELYNGEDHFSRESYELLKYHGTYQQDNRDKRSKEGKSYCFMVRTAVPGGNISSEQLLAEIDLGDEVGNSTLRITTRQGLQLHGVVKKNLRRTINRINEVKLTTIAACGDVKRNVMCSPCPYKGDPVYDQMQDLAERLAIYFKPQTNAYYELWLKDEETGEKHLAGSNKEQEVEPIYGPTYLPRKFKFAVGLPGDNSADIYANDVGILAICEHWRIVGYNILVGGSFGVTPSAKKTFQAIAQPMCFVTPSQVMDVATAIVKVQRDFGNRVDRKIARMKYLIHDWGLDRFKQKVEEYYGADLPEPRPIEVHGFNDGMGWQAQGDGKWFYGLNVENGRIKDEGDFRLKSALREICSTMAPPLRLTPHQSIIFCDLEEKDRPKLFEILHRHGVPLSGEISNARRWSMACPALPTCGLAITESERIFPGLIDHLESELEKLDLKDEVFTFRMTGCPNGCARPYNCDIGLVGKTKGKYTIFLGGRVCGDRLNFIYKDLVPEDEVIPDLVSVFRYFKEARVEDESFGDFCFRQGVENLLAACDTVSN